jgi:Ca2+-binding RTX toxin-like protein
MQKSPFRAVVPMALLLVGLTARLAGAQPVDLAVEFGPNPSPVPVGQPFSVDVRVMNRSPIPVSSALSVGIPPSLSLVSVTPAGTCSTSEEGGVSCSFSFLFPGETAPMTLTLFPPIAGTFTLRANIPSDFNPLNNSATQQITAEDIAAGFPFLDPDDVELELGQIQRFRAFRCPTGGVCEPISVCWSVVGGIGEVDPPIGPETDFESDFPGLGQVVAIADDNGDGFCNEDGPQGTASVAVVLPACAELCANPDGTVVNGRTVRHVTAQNPNITGTDDPEILCGDKRKNKLDGKGGDDILCGFAADDFLKGGSGDDMLFGHDGDDVLVGGPDRDRLFGGPGDDIMRGGPDEDEATGADLLVGGPGGDRLEGDLGDDRLFGDLDPANSAGDADAPGQDRLEGNSGNDLLVGGPDDDRLEGGPGNDTLVGQGGGDTLKGGPDDDQLVGGGDGDELDGGDGDDMLIGDQLDGDPLDARTRLGDFIKKFGFTPIDPGAPGADDLSGGPNNDILLGNEGADDLFGGPDNDILIGGPDGDNLRGGPGIDELFGQEGNDDLEGGPDDDHLFGGPDIDDCDGGSGQGDTADAECETVTGVP